MGLLHSRTPLSRNHSLTQELSSRLSLSLLEESLSRISLFMPSHGSYLMPPQMYKRYFTNKWVAHITLSIYETTSLTHTSLKQALTHSRALLKDLSLSHHLRRLSL
ncbi:unnamed protein product [Cuscuta epithymum]|uniref:Uncharacterized protein n=1 Tax=Cuscuta epithymum TaxID=186058 RepID=A0AAV0D1U7_9ASTE|nr:unnamed protein product [Cuscuta epithymum]